MIIISLWLVIAFGAGIVAGDFLSERLGSSASLGVLLIGTAVLVRVGMALAAGA